jgi:(2R)-sulfolactate sulfo-lyase subunit alpha
LTPAGRAPSFSPRAQSAKTAGPKPGAGKRGRTMATQFIVHDKKDTVGVVVVEDVKPGAALEGWLMEGDGTVKVKALKAVPLGHKIAMVDLKKGDTVLKYGHDIGRMIADAKKGDHVHVHNMKTKRW